MIRCEQEPDPRKAVSRDDVDHALDLSTRTRYVCENNPHRSDRCRTPDRYQFALDGGPTSQTFLLLVKRIIHDYKTDHRIHQSAVERLHECVLNFGEQFLQNVIRDATTYCEHGCRKTVTRSDIDHALDLPTRTEYSFEG
ncbi:hypothetical protein B484DRAFT_331346 [Ochromonadaceae sp. CCMP2298]|nr:hypothetical protein B484DRAFT_331346 [Ochromonadaceae sp. CCMP2298]